MRFNILAVSDFQDDGRQELVGSYDYAELDGTLKVPIGIAWEETAQRYVVGPIIAKRPPINPKLTTTAVGAAFRDGVDFISSNQRFHAWGAASLTMASGKEVLPMGSRKDVLLSGLPDSVSRVEHQVNPWVVQFTRAKPDVARLCVSGPRTVRESVVVRPQPGETDEAALRRVWSDVVRVERSGPLGRASVNIGVVLRDGTCFLGE